MCAHRVLRREDGRSGAAQPLALQRGKRYGVGASWTCSGVDLDLQCVVVDSKGVIVDCAYYNNLKAVRAITHSGDETRGKPGNIEEMIWIHFPKLKEEIAVLIFVVAAYSGGSLQDVTDGFLHIYEDSAQNEIAVVELERTMGSVDVVAAMAAEGERQWSLHIVDQPAQEGQHFMDILPLLGEVIREFLPTAPTKQKVAFAMEKGGVMDLPKDLSQITVGLGWDVDDGAVDLDVSAVLLDSSCMHTEAIFFGRLQSEEHGITHSGDNLTGEGEGDDEQIVANLDAIGPSVSQVVFVVNIYSSGRTFQQVASPYVRVVDGASQAELCRYALSDAGGDSGLIIAKIARDASGRWGFHALGLPCRGRTYKDSVPQIQETCKVKTQAYMLRSNSLSMTGDQTIQTVQSHSQIFAAPPPVSQQQSSACVLQ